MENYIARACMVSLLNESSLNTLHACEEKIGHPVMNWNIQEIFKLPAIRETYDIPEDQELQALHSMRLTKEIKIKILPFVEPTQDRMEWLHAFDWTVLRKKDEIIWDFTGGRSGKDRRFEKAASALKVLAVAVITSVIQK